MKFTSTCDELKAIYSAAKERSPALAPGHLGTVSTPIGKLSKRRTSGTIWNFVVPVESVHVAVPGTLGTWDPKVVVVPRSRCVGGFSWFLRGAVLSSQLGFMPFSV